MNEDFENGLNKADKEEKVGADSLHALEGEDVDAKVSNIVNEINAGYEDEKSQEKLLMKDAMQTMTLIEYFMNAFPSNVTYGMTVESLVDFLHEQAKTNDPTHEPEVAGLLRYLNRYQETFPEQFIGTPSLEKFEEFLKEHFAEKSEGIADLPNTEIKEE
jgi:hypothetical protein